MPAFDPSEDESADEQLVPQGDPTLEESVESEDGHSAHASDPTLEAASEDGNPAQPSEPTLEAASEDGKLAQHDERPLESETPAPTLSPPSEGGITGGGVQASKIERRIAVEIAEIERRIAAEVAETDRRIAAEAERLIAADAVEIERHRQAGALGIEEPADGQLADLPEPARAAEGSPFSALIPDLQNKATVALDGPQVPAAAQVQEPEIVPHNDADRGQHGVPELGEPPLASQHQESGAILHPSSFCGGSSPSALLPARMS